MRGAAAILISCLILYSCNRDRDEKSSEFHEDSSLSGTSLYEGLTEEDHQREDFDEDRARDSAEAEVSGESTALLEPPTAAQATVAVMKLVFDFAARMATLDITTIAQALMRAARPLTTLWRSALMKCAPLTKTAKTRIISFRP